MVLALIFIGSILGFGAGVTALIMGQSIWIALLIYSGVGMLGVLAIAVVVVLRTISNKRSYDGSRDPLWRVESFLSNIRLSHGWL